ncbi:MAG: hypothetical protein IJS05_04670 [Paludibacteraceae bacterium]|nr:hypothetical protein [Paludibacteraceae bacterium]
MTAEISKHIAGLESDFSCHDYNGRGKRDYVIQEGSIPIMISAPHATNTMRNGTIKCCDQLTGAICKYLHLTTNCHVIYTSRCPNYDPNYQPNEFGENAYQTELADYINRHNIQFLIDLHGAKDRDYAIEIGTAPTESDYNYSLKGYMFLLDLIKYTFEYQLQDVELPASKKTVCQNKIFGGGKQNTITKYIATNTHASCCQLEVNSLYRSLASENLLSKLIEALTGIINTLSCIEWNARQIRVFRLQRSATHKPQDKVELEQSVAATINKNNTAFFICSVAGQRELAKLHSLPSANSSSANATPDDEYIYLTNRLIEQVCGRSWIEGNEQKPALRNAPIVLCVSEPERYDIGLPKANQVDEIKLSTALYNDKAKLSNDYLFAVYNRYTDSRIYLDFAKADYQDHGRVSDKNGNPQKKIMIPRYYRRLLDLLYLPFSIVRSEGLEALRSQAKDDERLLLETCYERISGEDFYKLKTELTIEQRRALADIQRTLGAIDTVELLQIPRQHNKNQSIIKRVCSFCKQKITDIVNRFLEMFIGKAEYTLKTTWTSETDDKNEVARLSESTMNLLGIEENDKITVVFGEQKQTLRVLKSNDISDYDIGIPAPARKRLGMNSINDIVVVSRDMQHIFNRNSQAQIITLLGTFFAVLQLFDNRILGIITCLVLVPLLWYWVLNKERIKIK